MKNWKTTVFGFASGALNLFANGVNWKQVLLSVAIAALGVVAKDVSTPAPAVPAAPSLPIV